MVTLGERLKQKKFRNIGQESILSLLTAAANIREKFSLVCAKENISIQQYNILRILKGVFPDGYPRCEITERMFEKAPDTTRLIDRLVRLGFVVREKCLEDKRQSITKISEKGLVLISNLEKEVDKFEQNFEKKIGAVSCREYVKISEKILNM